MNILQTGLRLWKETIARKQAAINEAKLKLEEERAKAAKIAEEEIISSVKKKLEQVVGHGTCVNGIGTTLGDIIYENRATGTIVMRLERDNFAANARCGWTGDVCVWKSHVIGTPKGYHQDNYHFFRDNPARDFDGVTETDANITVSFNKGAYTIVADKVNLAKYIVKVPEKAKKESTHYERPYPTNRH